MGCPRRDRARLSGIRLGAVSAFPFDPMLRDGKSTFSLPLTYSRRALALLKHLSAQDRALCARLAPLLSYLTATTKQRGGPQEMQDLLSGFDQENNEQGQRTIQSLGEGLQVMERRLETLRDEVRLPFPTCARELLYSLRQLSLMSFFIVTSRVPALSNPRRSALIIPLPTSTSASTGPGPNRALHFPVHLLHPERARARNHPRLDTRVRNNRG